MEDPYPGENIDRLGAMMYQTSDNSQLLRRVQVDIPRFTLLMWGHTQKKHGSKNCVNRGYLVVLKGRKIG